VYDSLGRLRNGVESECNVANDPLFQTKGQEQEIQDVGFGLSRSSNRHWSGEFRPAAACVRHASPGERDEERGKEVFAEWRSVAVPPRPRPVAFFLFPFPDFTSFRSPDGTRLRNPPEDIVSLITRPQRLRQRSSRPCDFGHGDSRRYRMGHSHLWHRPTAVITCPVRGFLLPHYDDL